MIGVYTLNKNGEVPDFVVDGGYFAAPNGKSSPQDWNLVGVVNVDAPITFAVFNDFVSYLESVGADSWLDDSGEPIDYVAQASLFWENAVNTWVVIEP